MLAPAHLSSPLPALVPVSPRSGTAPAATLSRSADPATALPTWRPPQRHDSVHGAPLARIPWRRARLAALIHPVTRRLAIGRVHDEPAADPRHQPSRTITSCSANPALMCSPRCRPTSARSSSRKNTRSRSACDGRPRAYRPYAAASSSVRTPPARPQSRGETTTCPTHSDQTVTRSRPLRRHPHPRRHRPGRRCGHARPRPPRYRSPLHPPQRRRPRTSPQSPAI